MDYLNVCIDSLLKFNNDLDSLILYPNKLTGEEENNAIKIQKILNKNSESITKELDIKIDNFNKYTKEERAVLIVFYGDLSFSDNFDSEDWNNLIKSTDFLIDRDKIKKAILTLI